ncbi:hypothetical protein HELRODRAFT_79409, partial [Helobdella robusta]|uniref:HMG box domain-containing protein n=1 Tax=Helobdella robusta TaxID=6412 RepID=T1G3N5_HELRO
MTSNAFKTPKIKRPMNAFMLYRKDESVQYCKTFANILEMNAELGKKWKNEPQDVKDRYFKLAELEKQQHKQQNPDYKFRPNRK